MQCPSCGFENRDGARFCKQCGASLQEQPPETPAPEPAVCSSCGAPLNPGARFCNRCGQSVPAPSEPPPAAEPVPPSAPPVAEAAPPAYESAAWAGEAAPELKQPAEVGQPAAPAQVGYQDTGGFSSAPVPPPPDRGYAQPGPGASGARHFPTWIWGVLAGCLVVLAVFLFIVLFKPFGGAKEEPTPTPSPTVAAPATETPQPAATETIPPPVVDRPRSISDGTVALLASANPLHVGDTLTLQVIFTNTWGVPCTDVHTYLYSAGDPALQLSGPSVMVSPGPIPPNTSHTVTYTLNVVGEDVVPLEASVTASLEGESPRAEGRNSPPLEVAVEAAP